MTGALRPGDIARLLILAAIWGGSFIFIRVLSPVIGPVPTAASRVLIGGLAIVAYAVATRTGAQLSRFWWAYVVIGIVNSAIPFVLYGFAALHLPASYLGIFNSATPLFAALLAAVWLDERLTRGKLAGLSCGVAGVALDGHVSHPSFRDAVERAVPVRGDYGAHDRWLRIDHWRHALRVASTLRLLLPSRRDDGHRRMAPS